MKKLILSFVLVFFISMSTIKIYTYSKDLNTPEITKENTHILISQDMESGDGKNLMPTGSILGVNDTENITFTYTIFIQDGIEIEYYIDDIKIDSELVSQDIVDLFKFEFEINEVEDNSFQLNLFDQNQEGYYLEITLVLSMDFPNEEQYNLIANQQLSFEINFESVESLPANTM